MITQFKIAIYYHPSEWETTVLRYRKKHTQVSSKLLVMLGWVPGLLHYHVLQPIIMLHIKSPFL